LRVDEPRSGRQHPAAWCKHEGHDAIDEGKRDDHPDGDGDAGSDDTHAEFVKMLQEPHLAIAQSVAVIVWKKLVGESRIPVLDSARSGGAAC